MVIAFNIGGFQDPDNKRIPRNQVSKKCEEEGIKYYDCEIPGDTSSGKEINSKFSLKEWKEEIKNQIIEILTANNNEELDVYSYSLSARPAIDAIMELSEEFRNRIRCLHLIHPAYNPVDAVTRMDWCKDDALHGLRNACDYTEGNNPGIFDTLISGLGDYADWIGDAEQFQNDLKSYNETRYGWSDFKEYLQGLPFNIEIIGANIENDRIIHNFDDKEYLKEGKGVARVLSSHFPKRI